jgi:hypothetical protein
VTIHELTTYIFAGSAPSLGAPVHAWASASPAFARWAETYRDKIRKKVRNARDDAARQDLLAELAVAYWLLQDRRCTVEYELHTTGPGGPDFACKFRTHIPFMVEVTRLRPGMVPDGGRPDWAARAAHAICAKIGQFPPSIANVLALTSTEPEVEASAVEAGLALLAARAATGDDAFFIRYGFEGARDFRRQIQRISAVVFHSLAAPNAPATLWPLTPTRHPLPPDLVNALRR